MIRFHNYRKSYNGYNGEVISIPDLALENGVYWLKGENGSGKTTLMRSMAGLIPFEGGICVENLDIRKQRIPFRRIVNYAEAEPVYPDFFTGADLLRFYRATKGGDPRQTEETAKKLGVNKYIDHKISTYSSGMTKKLSLILAFIGNPRLILLDEPLITLDTDAVTAIQELIGRYHAAGVAFLLTSHQELDRSATVTAASLFLKNKTLTFQQ